MISIRRKTRSLEQSKGTHPFSSMKLGSSGFLQFSSKLDYGLFLMTELARHSDAEPLSLRQIAEKNLMSFFFLQKVALDLRRAGLIKSDRGKNGGYTLAKTAQEISMKDIIEALEGPLAIVHCLSHGSEVQRCVRESWCNMRGGLETVNQIIIKAITEAKLSDLFHKPWKQKILV